MDRVDYQSMIVQDLLNDFKDQKLDLNPWYQRRSVWTDPQKAYLINTLHERKPIPAIYIRHSIDLKKQKSIKEVVDGQQRCRAVIEYCNDKFAAKMSAEAPRRKFSDLTPVERERFLITPLPIGFLIGANDEDVIDIFGRINSVAKTLNAQEKRNAQYSGEFKQFALSYSSSKVQFWRSAGIFTANDIARMNEVQFVSDVIYNLIYGLSDFNPKRLDALYSENDEEFSQAKSVRRRLDKIFGAFLEMDTAVFSDTIFGRQPVFFSLIIVLDELGKRPDPDVLADALFEIDAQYNDDDLQGASVKAFREAVASSTQRIASREARHKFILSNL